MEPLLVLTVTITVQGVGKGGAVAVKPSADLGSVPELASTFAEINRAVTPLIGRMNAAVADVVGKHAAKTRRP